MQQRQIGCFWAGGPLSYLHHLSLTSFRDAGHPVAVYAYDPIADLPQGVEWRDAAHIMPRVDILRPDLLRDAFRYRLLAAVPGIIWAEPNFCLITPLIPQDDMLFGWQSAQYLGSDVLALPADSPVLAELIHFTTDLTPIPPWSDEQTRDILEARAAQGDPVPVHEQVWGVWGSRAMTHFLGVAGLRDHALPVPALYPFPYAQRAFLVTRKVKLAQALAGGALAIPLYLDDLSRMIVEQEQGLPKYWCPLGELMRKHDISPRRAPLPGSGALPIDRWIDRTPIERAARAATQPTPPAPQPVLTPIPGLSPNAQPAPIVPAATPVVTPVSALDVAPVVVPAVAPKRVPIKGDIPRILIITTMKNEGPFILEWIAYHRAIGVTDFLIYTNDCDDGTDTMHDLLERKGIITKHLPNPFDPNVSRAGDPQRAALWDAKQQPFIDQMDWIIPMDVDEFVNIHVGDGTFAALLNAVPDANMISMVWRLYGNDFVHKYEDKFITQQLNSCAPVFCKHPFGAWGFKTAFQDIGAYERYGVHRPKGLIEGFEDKLHWVSGAGRVMTADYMRNGWRANKKITGYDLVTLNHYSVRSAESYLVKRQRGRVNHIDHDQGMAYWFRMNHNAEKDSSIANKLPAAQAEFTRLMSDPEIAAAHTHSVAAHTARITQLRANEEYENLYRDVTSPRMENLSKMLRHFGNDLFMEGPSAITDEFLAWADRMSEDGAVQTTPPTAYVLAEIEMPAPDSANTDSANPEPTSAAPVRTTAPSPVATPAPAPTTAPTTTDTSLAPNPVQRGQNRPGQRDKSIPKMSMNTVELERPRAPSGDLILLGDENVAAFKSLLDRTQDRYPHLEAPEVRPSSEKITIITGMKNEAPFILEWVAYHKSIGVTDFLVYTNDCTDQTNDILDRLAELGHLTRLDNPFNREAGQKPQRGALNDAITQPIVRNADWYVVIDVDEFINVHVGDGTLQTLIAEMNDPNMIAMTWKFFGNGGIVDYQPGFITEQFTACAPEYLPRPRLGWGFKSMARLNAPFEKIGVHRPLNLIEDRLAELRWVNGSGRVMPEKSTGNSTWFSRKASIGYEMVTLNHYILRSAESFLVKRDRGRINHVDQDQGQDYWSRRNYSTETDTRILERLDPAKAIYNDFVKDPKLAELQAQAEDWHRARITALRADADYAKLFETIADPEQQDAIFVADIEPQEEEA